MLPPLIQKNRFVVLDLESTGVNLYRDEVVQIAVIQVDYGRPRIRAVSYVQPKRAISDGAMAAHGITWDILKHAPTLAEVWADFEQLMSDRVLLGYGIARFDVPLLARQLAEGGLRFDRPGLDVLPWERRLGGKGKHNLAAAAERWGVPLLPRHDALADCRMTWNVFLKLAELHPELGAAKIGEIFTFREAPPLPANLAL